MQSESAPVIRVTNVESGQAITLDPDAALMLATNLTGVALDSLGNPDRLLAAAASGNRPEGGGLLIQNEYGRLWLSYSPTGRLLDPPASL